MTRRSRHGHAWLAGAMIAALALLGAGAVSAQTVTWSMADEYPATSIQGEADARFAREVSRRTGGRIEIAHQYDASSGFRSREMVDAVGRGAVPLGNMYMGALGSVDPVFLLPSLPFLATTPEQGQALAAVARVLGLPAGSPLVLFAIGRTIGWIGHAIEQYEANAIIRPRAKYVGATPAV